VAGGAQMSNPNDLVVDGLGNIYFTDSGNQVIRKIN
jgi:sugar lactone lactonase YvrE